MNWGPISEQHSCRNPRAIGDSGGEPTKSSPSSFEGAPTHPLRYSATDMRHAREAALAPWVHVGLADGSVSPTDWDQPVKTFPDGPGAWRQT